MTESTEPAPYAGLPRYQPEMVLTVDDVRAMVDAAIKDKGEDYFYDAPEGLDSCLYLDPKDKVQDLSPSNCQAGCIFGHALVGMGVPATQLLMHNAEPIDRLLNMLDIVADHRAQGYASVIQESQDQGNLWTTSRLKAEAWLAESQSD